MSGQSQPAIYRIDPTRLKLEGDRWYYVLHQDAKLPGERPRLIALQFPLIWFAPGSRVYQHLNSVHTGGTDPETVAQELNRKYQAEFTAMSVTVIGAKLREFIFLGPRPPAKTQSSDNVLPQLIASQSTGPLMQTQTSENRRLFEITTRGNLFTYQRSDRQSTANPLGPVRSTTMPEIQGRPGSRGALAPVPGRPTSRSGVRYELPAVCQPVELPADNPFLAFLRDQRLEYSAHQDRWYFHPAGGTLFPVYVQVDESGRNAVLNGSSGTDVASATRTLMERGYNQARAIPADEQMARAGYNTYYLLSRRETRPPQRSSSLKGPSNLDDKQSKKKDKQPEKKTGWRGLFGK